jgi:hypothetical protein
MSAIGARSARVGSSLPEKSTPPLVGAVWALLLINTLSYTRVTQIIPFLHSVTQMPPQRWESRNES